MADRTCEKCNHVFSAKHNLTKHLRMSKTCGPNNTTRKCDLCPYTTTRKSDLKRHAEKCPEIKRQQKAALQAELDKDALIAKQQETIEELKEEIAKLKGKHELVYAAGLVAKADAWQAKKMGLRKRNRKKKGGESESKDIPSVRTENSSVETKRESKTTAREDGPKKADIPGVICDTIGPYTIKAFATCLADGLYDTGTYNDGLNGLIEFFFYIATSDVEQHAAVYMKEEDCFYRLCEDRMWVQDKEMVMFISDVIVMLGEYVPELDRLLEKDNELSAETYVIKDAITHKSTRRAIAAKIVSALKEKLVI